MKFETIKNKKKILLVIVVIFLVGLSIIISTSKAKYRITQSIKIASGTISYKPDKVAPTIRYTHKTETVGLNGWYTNLVLTISATDEISNISKVTYCHTTSSSCTPNTDIQTSNIQTINFDYTFDSSASAQKICAQAKDAKGNTSEVICSNAYSVDKTLPSGTFGTSLISNTYVTFTPSDGISGVGLNAWKYRISLDGGSTYGSWQGIETGFNPSQTYTLQQGVNVPVITGNVMNLMSNQKYQLLVDIMATSNVAFDIDLFPDTLPQVLPTATTSWQTYKWDNITSSSSDMQVARLRFFNDVTAPNPATISLKNINLYPKESHNIAITNMGSIKIQVQVTDNAGNQSTITSGLYEKGPGNVRDLIALAGNGQLVNEGDAGYRYEGATVNNYVEFNNETWRILAIEEGSKIGLTSGEYYIKLIREESIGKLQWHTSSSNVWSTSSLYSTLNNAYLNRTGDYASTGLDSTARSQIVKANWYTNGADNYRYTTSQFYNYERSNLNNYVNNYVGLMYPSDYGYASPQSTCGNTTLYTYNSSCYSSNWLYKSILEWTITPYSYYSLMSVYVVTGSGYLLADASTIKNGTRPSVYLKSDIKFASGNGSSGNKFKLAS